MRSLVSAILVIAALVLAAISGPAVWTERNIVDQSGFVALAGPLGANADFQQALSSMVARQATAKLNLPPELQGLAAGIIKSTSQSLYTQPGYPEAWSETLRRSHTLTFDPSAQQQGSGDVHLDVAPLVGLVGAKISADTGVSLSTPKQVLVSLDQPTVAKAIPVVTKVGAAGQWLALAAVLLLLLAVAVARRRALTLVLAGLGMGVVALAWLVGTGSAAGQVSRIGAGSAVVARFGSELAAQAQASWQWGIVLGFIVAVALVVVGLLTGLLGRGRAT
ncbi:MULTISPECIES: hypothetical protein [unclassified Arthrobacter]|uniref:hypothetical protein n=1 Tax=unclassified Arthrobacter TaxID=235627 RepID=UPI00159E926E|nr:MULTISPECIES: hypothetical protein [unclassified Arthrobacter]MCQ9165844.1 hypothetical protein [Arthrobacter sp. STN4]NVM99719.1 hypothetical protein [Arthrobacter sp. SDTb3-6]